MQTKDNEGDLESNKEISPNDNSIKSVVVEDQTNFLPPRQVVMVRLILVIAE